MAHEQEVTLTIRLRVLVEIVPPSAVSSLSLTPYSTALPGAEEAEWNFGHTENKHEIEGQGVSPYKEAPPVRYGSGPVHGEQITAIREASAKRKARTPDDLQDWTIEEAGEYLSVLTSTKPVMVPMSVAERRAREETGDQDLEA